MQILNAIQPEYREVFLLGYYYGQQQRPVTPSNAASNACAMGSIDWPELAGSPADEPNEWPFPSSDGDVLISAGDGIPFSVLCQAAMHGVRLIEMSRVTPDGARQGAVAVISPDPVLAMVEMPLVFRSKGGSAVLIEIGQDGGEGASHVLW